jgi:hypothetical protein
MATEFLPNIARINRMMWLGFAFMALGLAAILSPFIAGEATVIVLGLILLAAGLGQLFARGEVGRSRLWNAVHGAISVLSGFLVLAHPLLGLGFLPVDGLFFRRWFMEDHRVAPVCVCPWLVVATCQRRPVAAAGLSNLEAMAGVRNLGSRCADWCKPFKYRRRSRRLRPISQNRLPEGAGLTPGHEGGLVDILVVLGSRADQD